MVHLELLFAGNCANDSDSEEMVKPKSESALDKGKKNTNTSGTLKFKQITQPRPGDRIQLTLIKRKQKKKKLSGYRCSSRLQYFPKDREISGLNQRTKKIM